VILYSAAWCGYCRAAREFLASRRVPFVEKDVEKDPRAAAELAHKARRAGIHPSRIPIIDVRGRLVEGFDPVRLATLLGETT
jgi:glutaredoxin